MKIGRNDLCPCGSGRKFKRCCVGKKAVSSGQEKVQNNARVTLSGAIKRFQEMAAQGKQKIGQVGVFLLYTDAHGDAWVLEITDSDCIQIAASGKSLEVDLEESEERIIVDWSHSFQFKNKTLHIIAHGDKNRQVLANAPTQKLYSLQRKALKKMSPELLDQVHIDG